MSSVPGLKTCSHNRRGYSNPFFDFHDVMSGHVLNLSSNDDDEEDVAGLLNDDDDDDDMGDSGVSTCALD